MSRLIALHGLGRVGKDSLADCFVEQLGYIKLAFAGPLYQEVADSYDIDVELLALDEWKSKKQPQLAARFSNDHEFAKVVAACGFFADEALTSRQVLQMWGNDYKRAQFGNDYYAAKMIGVLRGLRGRDVVFSDLRHDTEACMGHWSVSRGQYESFKIIEVLRHGTQTTHHSSDHGLSKFLIDSTVRNNSTIDECFADLLNVLKHETQVRTHG